jgi:hypothetical protein
LDACLMMNGKMLVKKFTNDTKALSCYRDGSGR